MPRMADLIAHGKVCTCGDRLKILQAAVPIVADNVAEYLCAKYAGPDEDPAFVAGQLDWMD